MPCEVVGRWGRRAVQKAAVPDSDLCKAHRAHQAHGKADLQSFASGAKALSSEDSLRGALRAVSKVSTQIWAFLKNLAFEESSSHLTTLSAKPSSIYLLSSS